MWVALTVYAMKLSVLMNFIKLTLLPPFAEGRMSSLERKQETSFEEAEVIDIQNMSLENGKATGDRSEVS